MKTDTIIGIVGSILLVGVMVGVFIYEYNTVEEQNEDQLRRDIFAQGSFSHLDANEDIDGDEIPNYLDDDLDGDGISNNMDDKLERRFPFEGTFSATTGEFARHEADAFVGAKSVDVIASISSTAGLEIPLVGTYTLNLYVDGALEDSGSGPFRLENTVGLIELGLSVDALTLGGSYEGSFTVTY